MFQSHKARIQISLLLTGCATWENITLTSLCLSFLIGKMLLIIVPFLYGFGLVWFLRIRLTCKSLEQSWNKVSIQLILIVDCLLYVSCETWRILCLLLAREGGSVFPLQLVRGLRRTEVKYFPQNAMVRTCWRKENPSWLSPLAHSFQTLANCIPFMWLSLHVYYRLLNIL